jgi:hypothetical protein
MSESEDSDDSEESSPLLLGLLSFKVFLEEFSLFESLLAGCFTGGSFLVGRSIGGLLLAGASLGGKKKKKKLLNLVKHIKTIYLTTSCNNTLAIGAVATSAELQPFMLEGTPSGRESYPLFREDRWVSVH